MDKIGRLKKLLHGRQQNRMPMVILERVKELKSLLKTKKLAKLIHKHLPDFTDTLDYNQLKDPVGGCHDTLKAMDKAGSLMTQDGMGISESLNSIASPLNRLRTHG